LKGNPKDIGFQHGRTLKERIHSTVNWYKKIIAHEEKKVEKLTKHFKLIIHDFNSHYCDEIEAIARGAGIKPHWIYMLNARSEIMNTFRNECTALFFRKSGILGQNWDWAEELESLAVILKIQQKDKPEILMMTEPGIIGKIGFNSAGIGVCLNFLNSGESCKGIPIHILLRVILESTSIDEAIKVINSSLMGKSANILLGDVSGNSIDVEFTKEQIYYPNTNINAFIHTNHYLANNDLNTDVEKLASSFTRYETAVKLAQNISQDSIEEMKAILLDSSQEDFPICRPYVDNPDIGNVGTICSVIMDLAKFQMHITRGNPLVTPFTVLTLES
jgi:isopenicillin-N N-acyltransferase-like protein